MALQKGNRGKPSGHLLCGTGTLFSAAQVSGFQGPFPRQKSKSQSSSQAGAVELHVPLELHVAVTELIVMVRVELHVP